MHLSLSPSTPTTHLICLTHHRQPSPHLPRFLRIFVTFNPLLMTPKLLCHTTKSKTNTTSLLLNLKHTSIHPSDQTPPVSSLTKHKARLNTSPVTNPKVIPGLPSLPMKPANAALQMR